MKVKDCVLIEAFKCHENDNAVEVAKKLRDVTLRHIFVVDKHEYPVGVISITDINNRVVAEGIDAKKIFAKDIMSKPVEVADVNDDLEDLFYAMTKKHSVMEPVVKDKKMVGIITIHQIVKNMNSR